MGELLQKRLGRPYVFGMANDQCVWSRAGVARPMKCINAFDCLGCSFDRKILADYESRVKKGSVIDPRPTRMKIMLKHAKCRHMLSGRVPYKLCAHGYNCVQCPYDQMLEDTSWLANPAPNVCDPASGFNVARDHYYFYGHTWARVEYGGRVRLGIDDFAARLFGPADAVKLPSMGAKVEQGKAQAIIKRGRKQAPTLSPVDGVVLAVNQKVTVDSALPARAPYAEGWLMVVQPDNLRKDLKNLFFGEESLRWMDDEAARLSALVSDTGNHKMAATGGEVIDDIYGAIPGLSWERLVEEFLG